MRKLAFAVLAALGCLATTEVVAASGPDEAPRKKLHRIAVAPFISKANKFSVWGVEINARNWMDDVQSHLVTALTQCGGFKVLDREFSPETDRELNRISNDPNASKMDVCRLASKLSADYLIVAEVVFSSVAASGTDFATGLALSPPSAMFAEVRFRCVVAPTTQVAWADVIHLDATKFGGTAEQFSSSSARFAALDIANRLQSRLDPEGYAAAQKAAADAAARQPSATAPTSAPAASAGVNLGF